jgi:F-type H+-transporting ATPase subunit delta
MQGASRDALASSSKRVEQLLSSASAADAQRLGDELFGVVGLLDDQVGLRRVLSDPAVEPDRKAALAESVLASHVSGTAVDIVRQVVRSRWSRMRDLADGIEHLAVLAKLVAADKQHQADEVEDELFRFGRIVESRPKLREALADRFLPVDNKVSLVHALLDGKATPDTIALVLQLASHPRGRTPEGGLSEYGEIAARRRQRFVARVTTAIALSDDETARLRAALAHLYGHDVHLQIEIDAQIVGGLVVQVGDEVIDGSIGGRLADAKQQLK